MFRNSKHFKAQNVQTERVSWAAGHDSVTQGSLAVPCCNASCSRSVSSSLIPLSPYSNANCLQFAHSSCWLTWIVPWRTLVSHHFAIVLQLSSLSLWKAPFEWKRMLKTTISAFIGALEAHQAFPFSLWALSICILLTTVSLRTDKMKHVKQKLRKKALGSVTLTNKNHVDGPTTRHVSHTYERPARQRRYLIARDSEKPNITECCKSFIISRTLVTGECPRLSERTSLFPRYPCLFAPFSFSNGILFRFVLFGQEDNKEGTLPQVLSSVTLSNVQLCFHMSYRERCMG